MENVRKHQEENPAARSDLAQWSIETYIAESNRFLNENGSQAKGSREQAVSNEEESRVLREGYPENANQTLGKGSYRLFSLYIPGRAFCELLP